MTVGDTLSVLQVVMSPLLYAYSVFDKFLQSMNLTGVYNAALFVVVAVRFIIMPIVGSLSVGTGSDKSKKKEDK